MAEDAKGKPFLNRDARKLCWGARDAFFACVDSNGPDACAAQLSEYTAHCPSQWVRHFNKKRDYDRYRERMAQGFDPVQELK